MTARRRTRPRAAAKPPTIARRRATAARAVNPLSAVEYIVVVMMENRSFDHMLGYLNLPPWNVGRPGVDGVSLDPAWVRRFTNFYGSRSFAPHDFSDRPDRRPAAHPANNRPAARYKPRRRRAHDWIRRELRATEATSTFAVPRHGVLHGIRRTCL